MNLETNGYIAIGGFATISNFYYGVDKEDRRMKLLENVKIQRDDYDYERFSYIYKSSTCIIRKGKLYKDNNFIFNISVKNLMVETHIDEDYLYREVQFLKHLSNNKYIVNFLGFCCVNKSLHIITEYEENGDLYKYIENNKQPSTENIYYIIKGILKGLSFIHSHNILHRDLKSPNILLNKYLNILRNQKYVKEVIKFYEDINDYKTLIKYLESIFNENIKNKTIIKKIVNIYLEHLKNNDKALNYLKILVDQDDRKALYTIEKIICKEELVKYLKQIIEKNNKKLSTDALNILSSSCKSPEEYNEYINYLYLLIKKNNLYAVDKLIEILTYKKQYQDILNILQNFTNNEYYIQLMCYTYCKYMNNCKDFVDFFKKITINNKLIYRKILNCILECSDDEILRWVKSLKNEISIIALSHYYCYIKKDYKQTIEYLENLLKLHDNINTSYLDEIITLLISSYTSLKLYKKASILVEDLYRRKPDSKVDIGPFYNIGNSKYEESLEYLEKSDNLKVIKQIVSIYKINNDYDKAIQCLMKFAENGNKEAIFEIGQIYFICKNSPSSAFNWYRQFI
jgi:serine/threonine protein kinase